MLSSVGAVSPDADGNDGTETSQVGGNLLVPGLVPESDGQELANPEPFPVVAHESDVIGIGMRVATGDYFGLHGCHDGSNSCETGKATGWARVVQSGRQDDEGTSRSGP